MQQRRVVNDLSISFFIFCLETRYEVERKSCARIEIQSVFVRQQREIAVSNDLSAKKKKRLYFLKVYS